MKKRNYSFKEKLFLWPGESANWYFLLIPKNEGQQIRKDFATLENKKCFASVKVAVSLGDSVWQTALFYSKPAESYILPLKKKIRQTEDIEAGERISFSCKIL